jgi:pSer/pThr/pTyr-binding forkhead associated (FHA) protein
MPVLQHGGTIRELTDPETVVGSGATATWRIPGVDLAARHFTVALGDAGTTVRSCSTQNVVIVNGRQLGVRPLPLADGDTIAAGTTRFVYAGNPGALREVEEPARIPAYLIDERQHTAFELSRRSVSIGRDAGSVVVVKDPQVSRFHADVRTEAGAHVLYSMGSAGTRVNGHGVAAPRVLEEGDRIEIGSTTLVFTRGQVPPRMKVSHGTAEEDGEWSRRATIGATAIETGELPRVEGGGARWMMIVIGVAVVGGVLWILLR